MYPCLLRLARNNTVRSDSSVLSLRLAINAGSIDQRATQTRILAGTLETLYDIGAKQRGVMSMASMRVSKTLRQGSNPCAPAINPTLCHFVHVESREDDARENRVESLLPSASSSSKSIETSFANLPSATAEPLSKCSWRTMRCRQCARREDIRRAGTNGSTYFPFSENDSMTYSIETSSPREKPLPWKNFYRTNHTARITFGPLPSCMRSKSSSAYIAHWTRMQTKKNNLRRRRLFLLHDALDSAVDLDPTLPR